MDLSIIIVNWNSAEYLWMCLSSIQKATQAISYEVIVVDNDSDDSCEEMIRNQFPAVLFIQAGSNLGFARANNLGYSHSSGEYLLFLNPDTEIRGDALVKLLAHLRSHPSVAAAGVRLLNTDGSLQTACVQAFPTLSNQVLDSDFLRRLFPNWKGWGTKALFAGSETADVDSISGACFMIRRNVFEEVGRFSERYFMYSDDLDLSYKVHAHGYGIHYLNKCEIVHHGGKSSAQQDEYFSDLMQRQSMMQFFRNTKGALYCGVYRIAVALTALLRIGVVAMLILLRRSRIQGKPSRSVLQKWSLIFSWSLALNGQSSTAVKSQPSL